MSTLQKLDKPESAAAAYVLIISGVVAALQIGKLPPALPELSTSLGLSLMQAGFLLSLVQLAGMSLALVVGLSADGIGLRRSMLMGLIVLGLASAMGALAQSAAALMFWRAIEGLGFLWVTLPAPGLIRKRVSEQQVRKLLGYWGAYMPAGTALTLLVGALVVAGLGLANLVVFVCGAVVEHGAGVVALGAGRCSAFYATSCAVVP